MPIRLNKEIEQRLIISIQRYFAEQMDDEIGDLKATLLLEFCLKEIGPSIYNRAVQDARSVIQERVGELDDACFQLEFGYWND